MKELIKAGIDAILDSFQEPSALELSATHVSPFSDEGWSFNQVNGGVGSQAGEIVSPIRGLAVPAQFACVKVLAEDVGKLPIVPFRRIDLASKKRLTSGNYMRVLMKEAAPNITAMTFKQTLTQWAVNWGNGYAEIVRNARGEPVQLWPIHPSRVKVTRDSSARVMYEVHFMNGTKIVIPADDMLHIRGLGDDLVGWNLPVSVAKETMGSALAQIIFAASFFGNSVTPSAILTHPKSLGDKAQRRLRAGMRKAFGGARNSSKLLVLEEDMKYQAISMPLKQAQFLESRNFSVEEIARYHRMPLHKIQSMKQSTNNNIEQQAQEYLTDTLDPWLTRWEQEYDLKFWPNTDRFFTAFDTDALLRGDFESRTEGYTKMWNIGVLSINEIRAKENMNPVENGDTRFVPLNMIPLDQAIDMAENFNSERDGRRQQDPERQAQVAAVFGHVIKATSERLVKKECKALSGAHVRHGKALVGKMMDFYIRHEAQMMEALLPDTEAYFMMLGVDTEHLQADLQASCKDFCDEARNEISLAVQRDLGSIKGVLEKWQSTRAQGIADAIVGIGLACCKKSANLVET